MVKAKYGRIVSLSSRSALGNRGQVNYAAAKAGVQGITATLAHGTRPFNITRQRRRARLHRHRDDRRDRDPGRLRPGGVPEARRGADPAAPGRPTGGGRLGDRLPGQRRGVLRRPARPCTSTAAPAEPDPTARPSRPVDTSEATVDFSFSDEEIAIRDTAREFIRKEVMPLEPEVLRRIRQPPARTGARPKLRELQQKAKAFGFWGLSTPEEYGGMDLSAVMQSLIWTEVGRTFVPFRFGGEADNILYYANEEQKRGVPAADHRGRPHLLLRDHRARRRIGRGEHQLRRPAGRRRLGPQRREDVHHQRQRRRLRHRGRGHRQGEGRPRRRHHRVPGGPANGLEVRARSRPWARAARRRCSSTTSGCRRATSSARSARASNSACSGSARAAT